MINLLPDDAKRQIRAAHTNINLLKYLFIIGIAIVFLGAIVAGAYLILNDTDNSAQDVINASNNKADTYSSVQTQSAALTNSLAHAKSVLSKQVSYLKVLTGIAAVLPSGVVLNSLTLNSTVLAAPITLQAYAKTTTDALALKQNLQASPLFSNVSFQTINPSGGGTSEYPVSVSFIVTINVGAAQ